MGWQYATFTLKGITHTAVLIALSRLLNAEDFGLMASALVFVGLGNLFSHLGFAPALVQTDTLTPNKVRSANTVSLGVGLFLFLLTCLFIAPNIQRIFDHQLMRPVLATTSLVFLINSLGAVRQALLERQLKFRLLAGLQLVSYVLGYALPAVLLAVVGAGVWSLVAGLLLQSLILVGLLSIKQPAPWSLSFSWKDAKVLAHFGSGFTLARLLNYGGTKGDYLIIGASIGVVALGYYERAYQLMSVVAVYFGQAAAKVLFPSFSVIRTDKVKLLRLYINAQSLIGLVTLPVAAFMLINAKELVHVLLGQGWDQVVIPFQVLTAATFFRTAYKLDDALAKAAGQVYRRSAREALYALSVVFGCMFASRWGLVAVSAVVSAAIILNWTLATMQSLRILQLSWRKAIGSLLPGVLMAMITIGVGAAARVVALGLGLSALEVLLLAGTSVVVVGFVVLIAAPRVVGPFNGEVILSIAGMLGGTGIGARIRAWAQRSYRRLGSEF